MANNNFIVQNGLTVGGLLVFAGNGDVITSGNVTSTSPTSTLNAPVGTSAQRPGASSLGMIRYNTTTSSFEGYGAGGAWSSLGGVKSVDGKAYISAEVAAGSGDDVIRVYAGDSGTSTQVLWASTSNVKILPTTAATSSTTGALQVAGGAGIAGNLFVGGNLTVLGNVSEVNNVINNSVTGNLIIGPGLSFAATQANIQYSGNQNTYLQLQMQNLSNGSSASTDYVATANNGSDSDTYLDVGINSSGYTPSFPFGYSWPNDGYVYVQGNTTTNGGNLMLAVQNSSNTKTNSIFLSVGGQNAANIVANVSGTGVLPGSNVTYNLGSTTAYWNNLYSAGAYHNTITVGGGPVQPAANVGASLGGTSNYWSGLYTNTITVANGPVQPTGNLGASLGGTSNYWSTAYINSLTATGITVNTGKLLPGSNLTVDIGSTTAWFNNIYGTSTHALYADLAENYLADAHYTPGSVLMFGGDAEVTVADADTTRVAGVVSTNPAHLMNGGLTGMHVTALALTGRVPCLIIGPVVKGDLMVSAGFGYAKANNNAGVGQVIGKALENFESRAKGMIEIVVGRV